MLGWAHPNVRKAAYGESFFAPNEVQKESERYDILRSALQIYDPGFAEAFEATWWAQSLDECPPLKTWYDLLDSLPRDSVDKWAPIDKKDYEEIVPIPPEIAVGSKPTPPKVDAPVGSASQPISNTKRGCLPAPLAGCFKGCQAIAAFFTVILLICVIGSAIMWFANGGTSSIDRFTDPIPVLPTPTLEQEVSFASVYWITS
jgi:hypothetical protein